MISWLTATGSVDRSDACDSLHVRLCELVESSSLGSTVHEHKSGDLELLAGLSDGLHPSGLLGTLAVLELLLRLNVSVLSHNEIFLGGSTLGELCGTVPNTTERSSLTRFRHSFG